MNHNRRYSVEQQQRILLGVLCLVWLLVQIGFLYRFGVRELGDTGRYLGAGHRILAGHLPAGKAASYLGYDFFVAAFLALHLGIKSIAAAQIAVAFAALMLLYRLGCRLYDARVGLTALAVFALFPDASYWHSTILTDSLYSSMIIVSTWLAVSASSVSTALGAATAFCFTCAVRPNGVGFAVSGVIFVLCRLLAARRYGILSVTVLLLAIAAPFASRIVGTMAGREDLLSHYLQGTVIWGYAPADIAPPSGAGLAAHAGPHHPLVTIWFYLVHQPAYFWTLAAHRVGYFLAHARPYFAAYHNSSSLLVLVPAYALVLWSLVRVSSSSRCAKAFLAATLSTQAAIVAVTFADWDGRHLIPMLSIVFVLGAAGFWDIVDRWRRPPFQRRLLSRSP